MKGIGHFLSGLATASCFPDAVQSAGAGDPFLILLGAVSGLLPDTVDFRMCRYLWRTDHSVSPGVDRLDPKPVAETVAKAIDDAQNEQRMTTVKLDTMKLSPNYWRTYSVRIDPHEKRVTAKIG
ncbi:MAG: archaeal/vacuolar-type H+-ATPase subunit I, partial [Planctomycetota bacterium]